MCVMGSLVLVVHIRSHHEIIIILIDLANSFIFILIILYDKYVERQYVTWTVHPSDGPGRTGCAASNISWQTPRRPDRSRRPPPPAHPLTLSLGNCPGCGCCCPGLRRMLTTLATTLAPWHSEWLLNVLRRRPVGFIRHWGRHWHARCQPPSLPLRTFFVLLYTTFFIFRSLCLLELLFRKVSLGQILRNQ